MRYDLTLICDFCTEVGLTHTREADRLVQIELGQGAVLNFENELQEDDCAIFFQGTAWHTHGDFIFAGGGYSLQVNYLDALQGLIDGTILVCDSWAEGKLVDRWVTHCRYNDELEFLQPGEVIKIWRPTFQNLRVKQPLFAPS